ncbi:Regulatory protein BlaR1 [Symmachiella dynata]|uniref:M56 family metallopeptidase n=1 Tax=Symmachiella dynata TaxID=2527995 RepID=UPI00118A5559|nr:M56 family metallopeptidase [Symmachiella dynata]QDT48013.1 Regulatory protein BlaR1 [Symmachiella dynata]
MNFVSALNEMSHVWFDQMRNSLVDTTILLGVVSAVWLLLRKRLSAQVGCCLFLLVLVKAAIPLEIPGPSWLAALSPRQQWQQWVETAPPAPTNHVAPRPVNPHDLQPTASTTIDTVTSTPGLATTTNKDTLPANIAPISAPLAIQKRQSTLTTAAWLMILWGSTACAMLMRFAWIHIQFHRRLRSATRVVDDAMLIDLEKLRRAAGVRQTVRYFVTDEISSPAVWGILRPCLLLPSDFSQTYSSKQIQWIVLHEFAHIRHGDLWIALFQRLVQMLHVFNPAVWLANGMINRLREYACDDAALLATDASRRDCGGALLRAVEATQVRPASLAPALGIFRPGRVFRNRLIRILDTDRRVHGRMPLHVTGALILLAALVLPSVHGEDRPQSKSRLRRSPATKVEPNRPRFTANLPGGGSVKLVSVSKHPSEDGPWWQADGTPLEDLPYAGVEGKLPLRKNMLGLDFAFQFQGLGAETVRDAQITFLTSGVAGRMGVPVDTDDKPLPFLRIKSAGIADSTKRIDFRIGIPVGKWKSIATYNGLGGGGSSKKRKGAPAQTVTFLPPRQINSQVSVNFAHNIKDQLIQVIAIEQDGKTRHVHSHLTQVGGNDFNQAAVEFDDLKLDDIKEFRVEVRKLKNVYFKNVSTVRGFETKVTIEEGK